MVFCCVNGCTNRTSRKSARQVEQEREKGRTVSFVRFPRPGTKSYFAWLKALKDVGFYRGGSSVCSEHFPEDAFWLNEKGKLVPQKNVVPSIFWRKQPKVGGSYCSAPTCHSSSHNRPDLSFFSFPKDPDRCKQWVANCLREDLSDKSPIDLHNKNKLCTLHFTEDMFINSQKTNLVKTAVPTIFKLPCALKERYKEEFPLKDEKEVFKREKEVFILPKPSPSVNTPTIFLVSDPSMCADGSTAGNSFTPDGNLSASAFVSVAGDGAKPSFQLPLPVDSSKYFVESPSQCDENEEESDFDPSDYVYPVYMGPDSPENPTETSFPSPAATDSPEVMILSPSAEESAETIPSCEDSQDPYSIVQNPDESLTATHEHEVESKEGRTEWCRNCELLGQANKMLVNELEEKSTLLEEKERVISFLEDNLEIQRSLSEEKVRTASYLGISPKNAADPSKQLEEKDRVINYLQLEIIRLREEKVRKSSNLGVSLRNAAGDPSKQLEQKDGIVNYLQLEIIRLRKELATARLPPGDRWKLDAEKTRKRIAEREKAKLKLNVG